MKKIILIIILYVLAIFIGVEMAKFTPKPTVAELQSVNNFCSVNDIKNGEKGIGLTVFKGTKPLKFKVTFLDNHYRFSGFPSGYNLIVARYDSPYTLAFGMSGSPVFAYNKAQKSWCLVGAVSLMQNEKMLTGKESNLIGITPIRYMIDQRKIFGEDNKIKVDSRAKIVLKKFKPGEMIIMQGTDACTVTYVEPSGLAYACGHSLDDISSHQIRVPVLKGAVIAMIQGKLSSRDLVDFENSQEIMGTAVYQNSFGVEVIPYNLPLPKLNIMINKGSLHKSISEVIPNIGNQTPIFIANLAKRNIEPYYDRQYLLEMKGELKLRFSGENFTSLYVSSAYYDCSESSKESFVNSLALFFQRLEQLNNNETEMDLDINILNPSKALKFRTIKVVNDNQVSVIFQNPTGRDFTVDVPISNLSEFKGKILNFTFEPEETSFGYLLTVSSNNRKILESEISVNGYDIVSCGEAIRVKVLIN